MAWPCKEPTLPFQTKNQDTWAIVPALLCHILSWMVLNLSESLFLICKMDTKRLAGTSLVAQWLRICLSMQGTRVRALVQEDPTCRGATKPVHHNYWACALELMSHNYWASMPQLLKLTCLEPMFCNKRSHHNEKPAHRNQEELPLATTRESPHAEMKTQRSQK